MKTRFLGAVLLSLSLTALLSSCAAACTHENVTTLSATEATCTQSGKTEGKVCADCGETLVSQERVEPLGHTTETGICSRCGKNFGKWTVKTSVDEFGDPTSDQYVTNINYFEGTFSNSATTDSKLLVYFVARKDGIGFGLYEYGSHLVKNSYSRSTKYNITIKTPDGEKVRMVGSMYSGGSLIVMGNVLSNKANMERAIEILSGTGSISFYVEEADRTTTNYRFTVEASNFGEMYKSLK